MKLNDSIETVKGVGPSVVKKLKILGIENVEDLVNYFPRRYEDFSNVSAVKDVQAGPITLKVRFSQVKGRYGRRGLHVTEAAASDETGNLRVVWFNQPYRAEQIKKDSEYYVSGEYQYSNQRYALMNPAVELVSDFTTSTARIIPIYRETKGFKSHTLRKLIRETSGLIAQLEETLPDWLVKENDLMPRAEAVQEMHFPSSSEALTRARKRLAFEEILELSLASLLNKKDIEQEKGPKIAFDEALAKQFVAQLSFTLTDAQRRAAWRVVQDLTEAKPMNRLLEGDVGSGKTVVAAMAALMAIKQGFQVAVMAPTEILARQHMATFEELLAGFDIKPTLLIGSLKANQKDEVRESVTAGSITLLVGTHALVQEKVDFKQLGLVIVDEQHRFGVKQRQELQVKAGLMPHVLSMTATPIPRTLALTVYGELDVSVIDELPPGRKPTKTKLSSPSAREQVYRQIDKQIEDGRQVFVVYPIIEESDVLGGKGATEEYERLKSSVFKHRRIGLLHGRLKPTEKEKVMQQFVEGKLDMLVSTTVVEVGVNVPNANVMLIEGAERFGLAQIHQLRGRVGRSTHQAYCYLITTTTQQPSRRLRELELNSDGFKLAEIDLELRGPGEIYGARQHGALDLRIAKLTDVKLIEQARGAAQQFIDKGKKLERYKHLASQVQKRRAITTLN